MKNRTISALLILAIVAIAIFAFSRVLSRRAHWENKKQFFLSATAGYHKMACEFAPLTNATPAHTQDDGDTRIPMPVLLVDL